MVEQVKQKASFGELIKLRRQFGKGAAGKLAFRTIIGGVSCEAIINGQRNSCPQPADRTVDFDVLGGFNFVCSCAAHEEFIGARILADLGREGRTTALGRNGWGRT